MKKVDISGKDIIVWIDKLLKRRKKIILCTQKATATKYL
jgi:hypothetical protein